MRFQLVTAWPLNDRLIEAGAVVDTALPQFRGLVPPPDVIALNQQTYDWAVGRYGVYAVRPGPGVTSKAPPHVMVDHDKQWRERDKLWREGK